MADGPKAQEFIPTIGENPPALVYLFCPGKTTERSKSDTFEPLMADRAVEKLIATYVDPTMKDLCYGAFYADETPVGDMVLEAQTLPFLAERRVLLVRNAERYLNESNAGAWLHYLDNPCDTALILFIAAQVDRRTKFYKACKKTAAIIECPQLSEREAQQWARAEIERRGKSASSGAIREILARAGNHLSDVLNAIQVLCSFVGTAERIEEADVTAACADVAEEEIWALTDAIAAANPGRALESLHKLMDLGKGPDDLMGTINWLLKCAYAVAIAGQRKAALHPFVAEKVAPLAEKLGTKKLRAAFALCTDTHFMLRSTGVDEELALELLVVKLAVPRKQQRAAS